MAQVVERSLASLRPCVQSQKERERERERERQRERERLTLMRPNVATPGSHTKEALLANLKIV
jgi:hypothetical protein